MSMIKICGLTRYEDIEAVNSYLPDFIGFVFYRKSKRYIKPEKAAALKKALDKRIKAVGVFVNEDIDELTDTALNVGLDIVQFHGGEDNDYIKEVKDRTGLEVWKAFGIKDGFNIERINRCAADRVLADAYTESYGGAGRIFNWDIIKTAENARNKIILAGGLDSMNIESAARNVAPYALDLSSGVETGGFKDEKKIKEIVRIVRNLESKAGERYGIPKTRK